MKIGFIGAGKAGFSLGRFFSEKGIQVTGYWNRHQEAAMEAAEFTGTEYFEEISQLIEESDAIFITVADGAIRSVYEQLKSFEITGKHLCHVSGAMSAEEAFPEIEKYNAYGYSIHPLFPISDKLTTYEKLQDAFFCIEGCPDHIDDWEKLLKEIGLKVRKISSENKVRYHAACVMASNLVCALVQESVDQLETCGFTAEEALMALAPLVRANTDSILKKGPREALTGPVERCDSGTVKKHLECLGTDSDTGLYRSASKKLVEMASLRHPDRDYSELQKLLEL